MSDKKNPQEASNIFYSIIEASVKPIKKASEMHNYELVLRFIKMHPDLNSPIHIAIGDRITKQEVEEIVNEFLSKDYLTIINSKPTITEKGITYLETNKSIFLKGLV